MTRHFLTAGVPLGLAGILVASGVAATAQSAAGRRPATVTSAAAQIGQTVESSPSRPHPSIPGGLAPAHVLLGRSAPESDELRQLREDAAQAEREIATLLEALPSQQDAEKETTRARIQELLAQQFESRQRSRDLEIAELEAEVKKLRELHRKREAAKDEIVRARLEQLIRSAEGLGWDGEAHGAYPNVSLRVPASPLGAPSPATDYGLRRW